MSFLTRYSNIRMRDKKSRTNEASLLSEYYTLRLKDMLETAIRPDQLQIRLDAAALNHRIVHIPHTSVLLFPHGRHRIFTNFELFRAEEWREFGGNMRHFHECRTPQPRTPGPLLFSPTSQHEVLIRNNLKTSTPYIQNGSKC